jgi:hypothetical protein
LTFTEQAPKQFEKSNERGRERHNPGRLCFPYRHPHRLKRIKPTQGPTIWQIKREGRGKERYLLPSASARRQQCRPCRRSRRRPRRPRRRMRRFRHCSRRCSRRCSSLSLPPLLSPLLRGHRCVPRCLLCHRLRCRLRCRLRRLSAYSTIFFMRRGNNGRIG